MLNRHLIRLRALQSLYAFEKSKEANFMLAQDVIAERFAPDLNSVVVQDRQRLQGLKKLSQQYFIEEIIGQAVEDPDAVPPEEVREALSLAKDFYKNQNKKDERQIKLNALADAQAVYDLYINILALLVELRRFSALSHNKVLNALADSERLKQLMLKKGLTWQSETKWINQLWNDAIKENTHYTAYVDTVNKTANDDLSIIKYLIKNVILKHELSQQYFGIQHLYWDVDKEILRTMLFQTFREFEEEGSVIIEELDESWEDTITFLKELLDFVIEKSHEIENFLKPYLKNWELERIIDTDLILLKMAYSEFVNFPSIPVKVTINEVIELSKAFGSPKSGKFVNGVLDTILRKLKEKGLVKKTGRGMLDNK